jgi:hypothetical protein
MIVRMLQNCSDLNDRANDPFSLAESTHSPDRRQRTATCAARATGDSVCRAVPRYVCLSHGAGHELCGVHVVRTGMGFRCPLCGGVVRPFTKRGYPRRASSDRT